MTPPSTPATGRTEASLAPVRAKVRALGERLGRNVKVLIGQLGHGGPSNGVEPIALRARDAGFEVVYQGTCAAPAQVAQSALEEDVHLVGLSVPSGYSDALVPEVMAALRAAGAGDVPVVIGGPIPEADARALEARGVARVYTSEAFAVAAVMDDLADHVRRAHGLG